MLDVESGQEVTNKFIKLAIKRSRKDEKRNDIFFSEDKVLKVFEFFSFLKINVKNKYQQFQLTPYQAWMIYEMFGWYIKKTSKRRYKYAMLFTARKTGKTVYNVAIMLYMLMYDGELTPESYLLATTREQAGQALDYAKEIVRNSPALEKRLDRMQYMIRFPAKYGKLRVLSADASKLDSLNVHSCIVDEMHEHSDLKLFNVMKSGAVARENPLIVLTSTAGFSKEKPFYKMVQFGKKVLEGDAKNDSFFYALYCLDEADDYNDPDTWVKANPNINVTVDLDTLVTEWETAQASIAERNNFLVKNLNYYLDSDDMTWIADKDYEIVQNPVDIDLIKEKELPCYIGIDLALTRDLASLVAIFYDDEVDKFYVVPEFFYPGENEQFKVRKTGVDLDVWIEEGYIHDIPSKIIDFDYIYDRIAWYNDMFGIELLCYDQYNATMLINKVSRELAVDCRPVPQVASFYNLPMKFVEKLIMTEKIDMGESPVLRWNFNNVVLHLDANANQRPLKNKSKDAIDGVMALCMALGAWMIINDEIALSIYEEFNIVKSSE